MQNASTGKIVWCYWKPLSTEGLIWDLLKSKKSLYWLHQILAPRNCSETASWSHINQFWAIKYYQVPNWKVFIFIIKSQKTLCLSRHSPSTPPSPAHKNTQKSFLHFSQLALSCFRIHRFLRPEGAIMIIWCDLLKSMYQWDCTNIMENSVWPLDILPYRDNTEWIKMG